MKQETKCLHSGYVPKNGEPRHMPIYQSTTFKYDSSDATAWKDREYNRRCCCQDFAVVFHPGSEELLLW